MSKEKDILEADMKMPELKRFQSVMEPNEPLTIDHSETADTTSTNGQLTPNGNLVFGSNTTVSGTVGGYNPLAAIKVGSNTVIENKNIESMSISETNATDGRSNNPDFTPRSQTEVYSDVSDVDIVSDNNENISQTTEVIGETPNNSNNPES